MESDPRDELPPVSTIIGFLIILTNQWPSTRVHSYSISWESALLIFEIRHFYLSKFT